MPKRSSGVVRFCNYDVVFAEIPGETTLAINIAGCPNRCPGCHSPHLQADAGEVLDDEALGVLLGRYGPAVTAMKAISKSSLNLIGVLSMPTVVL